jgi:hypothetical protein
MKNEMGVVGLVAPTPYTSQNCTPINSTPKFDEDMRVQYKPTFHNSHLQFNHQSCGMEICFHLEL